MNPTIRGFIKKELTQALRDKRMRIVIFAIPIVQMLVFGLALSNEIRNIRFILLAAPGDTLAKRLEERCISSGWFNQVNRAESDPVKIVQKGWADVVITVPPGGLTKAAERGEGRVQLVVDASDAIRARTIENYIRAVTFEVSRDAVGQKAGPAPVQMDVRMLFNPSMRTPVYLVPGVMCMILCLLTVILTSMSMSREKELGTFETLISAPVEPWEILAGKTLPFVLLGMLDVPMILAVAIYGFKVPMTGQVWELALAALVFVCTTVSVGTVVSTFAKNQQQAMMGGFLFLFPAIQLSGVMAPLDNIPLFFKFFAAINPLNYFVSLLRNIMLKGGETSVVWSHIAAMTLLATIAMTISYRRFQKKLN